MWESASTRPRLLLVPGLSEIEWAIRPQLEEWAEVPIGRVLGQLDCPILIAKHEGCLAFTAEGFEEAVEALPDARPLALDNAPATSEEFAAAVREIWG